MTHSYLFNTGMTHDGLHNSARQPYSADTDIMITLPVGITTAEADFTVTALVAIKCV